MSWEFRLQNSLLNITYVNSGLKKGAKVNGIQNKKCLLTMLMVMSAKAS